MTERVYPIIIRQFSRRHGSGGNGKYKGGDGCIREIEFTETLDVAILSQRRVIPPYGMAGGDPGQCGVNQWHRKMKAEGEEKEKYTVINLGGSNQCVMNPGDRILIFTPGGGGYGKVGDVQASETGTPKRSTGTPVHGSGSLATRRAQQNTN